MMKMFVGSVVIGGVASVAFLVFTSWHPIFPYILLVCFTPSFNRTFKKLPIKCMALPQHSKRWKEEDRRKNIKQWIFIKRYWWHVLKVRWKCQVFNFPFLKKFTIQNRNMQTAVSMNILWKVIFDIFIMVHSCFLFILCSKYLYLV